MVVLRRTIGDVLRDERRGQHRTLREVSSTARVSLGYLSEVERGQKEASSELLASICTALDVPLSQVLGEVTRRIADEEGVRQPYAAEGIVPAAPRPAAPVPAPAGSLAAVPSTPARAAATAPASSRALPVVGQPPAVDPARPADRVADAPGTSLEAVADSTVDGAAGTIVDSAVDSLSGDTVEELTVELDGLPEELELILRRRLVPAA